MKRALMVVWVFVLGVTACGGGSGDGGDGGDSGGATPPPPTIDTAPIDARAATLAAQIRGGPSADAVPQALLAAGFTIQAPDGSLSRPDAAASQGLLFSQWDADVMTAGIGNGGFVTLDDLVAAVQQAFPEVDATVLRANLVADVVDSAQSMEPTVRLWSRLIVELGRQRGASAYDLLDPNVDPARVELDPVQINLLLQWLIGEVANVSADAAAASGAAAGRVHALAAAAAAPCTLTDTQEMIMDNAAKAEKQGFKRLIKYLESKGVAGAGTLGKISGRLSAVLGYAKLLASLLAFNMDFKANLDELVRTLSTRAGGQQMKVTMTVRFDNGNAQLLNCVRQVGNLIGVDFKLNPTGPIKHAEVNWYLIDGGTDGIAGQLGYLRWVQNNIPNVSRFTDDNGQDTIAIEGAPQKRMLVDPHSVEKPGKVHAKINLKSANIVQDLLTALGGASTLPLEMVYRTGLGFERSYGFTVVDWEDCDSAGAGSASRVGALAANVCRDTWVGTASFTMGSDPATAVTTSASVTWVLSRIEGDIRHYQPTGTASYAYPNCTVTPSSQTMSTDPGGGTGGDLAIDYSTDPLTYRLQGSTVWQATYCGGLQAGAGGLWVGDPATMQFVTGTIGPAVDPQTKAPILLIDGHLQGQAGTTDWSFKHQ